jgi:hypothetical protein
MWTCLTGVSSLFLHVIRFFVCPAISAGRVGVGCAKRPACVQIADMTFDISAIAAPNAAPNNPRLARPRSPHLHRTSPCNPIELDAILKLAKNHLRSG